MAVKFQFDAGKAIEAILFLASRQNVLSNKYTLGKLLFLADKYHLVRFGRPITGDRFCAMEYGPVLSSSLELLNEVLNGELLSSEAQSLASQVAIDRNFRHPRFRATQSFKQYALSTSDIEALQAVADKYGMKSFDELKALTHEMVAYKRAWNSEGRIVNNPTMAFEDFFEEEDDALSGAFEDMLETDALRKVFGTVPV